MAMKTPILHTIVAIDPGVSGGIVALSAGSGEIVQWSMPESSDGICNLFQQIQREQSEAGNAVRVVQENINGFMGKSLPGSRMFVMGRNFGITEGAAKMAGFSVTLVTPRKWQGDLNFEKGDLKRDQWKRFLKRRACDLYPDIRITSETADAILIMHWARNFLELL